MPNSILLPGSCGDILEAVTGYWGCCVITPNGSWQLFVIPRPLIRNGLILQPQPKCPYCGCVRDIEGRQIEVVDGELEEIDPDLVRQARAEEQRALNKRVQQTRGLPDLARLAVELGRDAGWVFNVYKHRPDGRKDIPYGEVVRAMAKAKIEMEKAA